MGEIWRRFSPFEKALLLAAACAALATVGDLSRKDGLASVALGAIVTGACVGAAGGSRKRRLMGHRRQLGPIEQIEQMHPTSFVVASGAILGALFAANNGWAVGLVFGALWIGSQLAVMQPGTIRGAR